MQKKDITNRSVFDNQAVREFSERDVHLPVKADQLVWVRAQQLDFSG